MLHGVRDADIQSGVHSLTNWIACLRNSNARERTLQRCQENRINNRPKPKPQAQKAPSARREEENDVDPILREISFLVSVRGKCFASSRRGVMLLHNAYHCVHARGFFSFLIIILKASSQTDEQQRRDSVTLLSSCITHTRHAQDEYDHAHRVMARAADSKGKGKDVHAVVKVTVEALRKLQASKNKQYLTTRRPAEKRGKEININTGQLESKKIPAATAAAAAAAEENHPASSSSIHPTVKPLLSSVSSLTAANVWAYTPPRQCIS